MAGKPSIPTGTLLTPADDAPVALRRAVATTSTLSFAGMPDPDSPAQRTFHQALLNRSVGVTKVYQFLREFGFGVHWGHEAPEAPGARLHLTVTHQQGVKVAVMFKSARVTSGNWSSAVENRLTGAGWHILILDAAVVVQTPQEAVNAFLSLLSHLGQIDFQGGPALEAPPARPLQGEAHDAWPTPEPVPSLARLPRPRPRRRRRLMPALLALAVGLLAVAGVSLTQKEGPIAMWRGGVSFRAKVDAVEITKEGHASLKLSTGHKAFVPAHAIKQNAGLLHELIVAWRQGKPLTVFTTNKQHAKHGRQVGVKDVAGAP